MDFLDLIIIKIISVLYLYETSVLLAGMQQKIYKKCRDYKEKNHSFLLIIYI
jgi:hypothetical protein